MIGRVIEIANDGRHLARSRGFMTVSSDGNELGRVPLDDIAVLLCSARGLTYSNGLITELSKRGVAVVLCGSHYLPVAWIWPIEGNHRQTLRMRCQLEASKPLCKRLWQAIVKEKVKQQSITLEMLKIPSGSLKSLGRQVRSGDPSNVEGRAARLYWQLIFGGDFKRERFGPMPNPLLNYGYTVLRAEVARAIVSCGLHPSIGIHHHNRGNPMCLADDLIEPFRPLVDYTVAKLLQLGTQEVDNEAKSTLVGVLAIDMNTDRGVSPVQLCIERAAQSLAQSFEDKKPSLVFPSIPVVES
ncbi:MAG: type II CRISPR-associated endonuclease Cas1 [Chloroflexi bacterium]|nr:type II CRISPR-associated endonuclease Cas1 [Chloroflexota bacterium]